MGKTKESSTYTPCGKPIRECPFAPGRCPLRQSIIRGWKSQEGRRAEVDRLIKLGQESPDQLRPICARAATSF